jgi:hypothetical protein
VASKPDARIEPCKHQGSLEYALLQRDPAPFTSELFFAEVAGIPVGDRCGGGSEFDTDSHILEPQQPLNASTTATYARLLVVHSSASLRVALRSNKLHAPPSFPRSCADCFLILSLLSMAHLTGCHRQRRRHHRPTPHVLWGSRNYSASPRTPVIPWS